MHASPDTARSTLALLWAQNDEFGNDYFTRQYETHPLGRVVQVPRTTYRYSEHSHSIQPPKQMDIIAFHETIASLYVLGTERPRPWKRYVVSPHSAWRSMYREGPMHAMQIFVGINVDGQVSHTIIPFASSI